MGLTSADTFGVVDLGLAEEESAVGQVTRAWLCKTDIVLDEEDVALVGVQSFHFCLFILRSNALLQDKIEFKYNKRPSSYTKN